MTSSEIQWPLFASQWALLCACCQWLSVFCACCQWLSDVRAQKVTEAFLIHAKSRRYTVYQFTRAFLFMPRAEGIYHRSRFTSSRDGWGGCVWGGHTSVTTSKRRCIFKIWWMCSIHVMNVYYQNLMNVCKPRDECFLSEFDESVLSPWRMCTI